MAVHLWDDQYFTTIIRYVLLRDDQAMESFRARCMHLANSPRLRRACADRSFRSSIEELTVNRRYGTPV